jgi:four helix bundle protein
MDFTDMPVWKKSIQLLLEIYQLTKKFPPEERYGLSSDMRRAANSVAHNIAEGFGRFERKDKTRFYKTSRGSSFELISQTTVCSLLLYCNEQKKEELEKGYREVIDEINALIKTVELRQSP